MLNRNRTVKFLHAGIDKLLAQHIAHLFIRDPISVFKERLNLDDENDSDHFEVRRKKPQSTKTYHRSSLVLHPAVLLCLQNLQSTNWQTMRFKPPPPNSDIGWRVEFRPMEVTSTASSELLNLFVSNSSDS